MKKIIPYLWLVMLALFLMWFAFGKGVQIKLLSVLMIGIHIAIPIIISSIHDKKVARKYEDYRREFVKEINLDLSEFGSFGFEYNVDTGELTLVKGFLPVICGTKVTDVIVEDYNDKISLVTNCLHYIHNSKDKITKMCLKLVKETYEYEGITEYGEELITDDFILKHMILDSIVISIQNDTASAVVMGYMDTDIEDHISEHGITVNIFADGRIELE